MKLKIGDRVRLIKNIEPGRYVLPDNKKIYTIDHFNISDTCVFFKELPDYHFAPDYHRDYISRVPNYDIDCFIKVTTNPSQAISIVQNALKEISK